MANFNTQTEQQIKDDLSTYGYTWKETTNTSSPLIMYFEDNLGSILKLSVDTTSYAYVYDYGGDSEKYWLEQVTILTNTTVTDLNSLDVLLIAQYDKVDPVLIKGENLKDISNREVLSPTVSTYYQSTIYTDSNSTQYKISEKPSPYRDRTVIWVPVTFNNPNWTLTYDDTVIVATSDVVTNTYGDFIVVKSE